MINGARSAAELGLAVLAERYMRGAVRVVLALGAGMAVLHIAMASVAARNAVEPVIAFGWALAWVLAWRNSDRVLDVVRQRSWVLVAVGLAGAVPIAVGGAWQSRLLADQMAVAWLAAVAASWRVALATGVAIGAAYICSLLADGNTPGWLAADAQRYDVVTNSLNGVLAAAAGLAIVSGFRGILNGGAAHLERVRLGAPGATPALATLVRGARPSLPLPPVPHGAALSEAERAVVALLGEGLAPKEIAVRRSVSVQTVRTQIKIAKRKTGAKTIEQLVALIWAVA